MGQIIIDLPQRIKRRFRLNDEKTVKAILKSLEDKGELVEKTNSLENEDLADAKDALAAKKEYLETGESYSVGQLRKEFKI